MTARRCASGCVVACRIPEGRPCSAGLVSWFLDSCQKDSQLLRVSISGAWTAPRWTARRWEPVQRTDSQRPHWKTARVWLSKARSAPPVAWVLPRRILAIFNPKVFRVIENANNQAASRYLSNLISYIRFCDISEWGFPVELRHFGVGNCDISEWGICDKYY